MRKGIVKEAGAQPSRPP